jgi:hypothetical protein
MSDPNHKAIINAPHTEIQRMHPVVAAALATGPDPATLRELLAVQREWESGEAKKAYTRALTALKRDMPTVIGKDTTVDFQTAKGRTRYTHTSLAAAMDAVTGPLTAHGFSLGWEPSRNERGDVVVTCRLVHSEGHSETCTLSAPVDTSGSKSPAQGVASTVTLLSRYTALALLGIATADMGEPVGNDHEQAADPARVDANRNLRAASALQKYGRTREEAEHHLGRKVSEWTDADLARLKEWLAPPKQPKDFDDSVDAGTDPRM